MKKCLKRGAVGLAAMGAMGFAASASAGLPVIDGSNLAVNILELFELKRIGSQLDGGDIHNYTANIDKSTTSIDNSTKSIDKSTYESWQYDIKNFDITNNFDWTVIIGGGGGVTPIPDVAGNFGNFENYEGNIASRDVLANADVDGSLAQKAANDQLVKTMIEQQSSLEHDVDQVQSLIAGATKAQGHGHQLQYANAFAGEQAHQMLQVRSLMLASNNAQSAAAQAQADREAREIASARSLRRTTPSRSTPASIESGVESDIELTGKVW